jgi:hypothetical protein
MYIPSIHPNDIRQCLQHKRLMHPSALDGELMSQIDMQRILHEYDKLNIIHALGGSAHARQCPQCEVWECGCCLEII